MSLLKLTPYNLPAQLINVFFLLLLFLNSGLVKSQYFVQIPEQAEIPKGIIWDMAEDQHGFIWVATDSGVVFYDGFQTTQVLSPDGSPITQVRNLLVTDDGSIWMASQASGVWHYQNGKINQINFNDRAQPIKANELYSVKDDVWVGTHQGIWLIKPDLSVERFPYLQDELILGVLAFRSDRYLLTRQSIFHWSQNADQPELLTTFESGVNSTLLNDPMGRLWLTRTDGLYQLNGSCDCFQLFNEELTDLNIKTAVSTATDLWLGTIIKGLVRYNYATHQTTIYRQQLGNQSSLQANHVFSLLLDGKQNLWVGSFENGISSMNLGQLSFQAINQFTPGFGCAKSSVAYDLYKQGQKLWVATEKGLLIADTLQQSCDFYDQSVPGYGWLPSDFMTSFNAQPNGLYVTTDQGFIRLDIESNEMFELLPAAAGVRPLFAEKLNNSLWILGGINDLVTWDESSGVVTDLIPEDSAFNSASYFGMVNKDNGGFYLMTNRGLLELTASLDIMKSNDFAPHPISLISALEQTPDGHWLSGDRGQLIFRSHSGELVDHTPFIQTTQQHVSIYEIVRVSDEELWFATNEGLMRYNPVTHGQEQFSEEDGVLNQAYKIRAEFLAEDGQIYLGGKNGFTAFYPKEIPYSSAPIRPIISSLYQGQNELSFGKRMKGGFQINQSIPNLTALQLNHLDDTLTLTFSSLDIGRMSQYKYAQRLVGFDSEWQSVKSPLNQATYTNLDPGDYTFQVKTKRKGLWSEPSSLSIKVNPAPWLSPWAFALYSLLFVAAVFAFIHHRTASARKRAAELEAEVNHRTQELKTQKQMVESLLDHKNELFANVTHEFKTPLALIKGPTEQLITEADLYPHKSKLQMIVRNTNRLLLMVGQILKLSEVEQQQMVVREYQDVKPTLDMLVESFGPLASNQNLEFKADISTQAQVYGTPDMLEMVVGNLLSNAIKYTQSGGSVSLSCHDLEGRVYITVTDSGPGISVQDQAIIFDRFTRLESHRDTQGTGIGLAVVKAISNANSGQIKVTSELGKGSQFCVDFPVVTAENAVQHDSEVLSQMVENTANELMPRQAVNEVNSKKAGIKILLIEDNADMRTHVGEILQQKYHCLMADRGRKGVALALKEMPDIIICDVMMPEMDGFQVTRILRHDVKTSHIPIVLLTALNTKESRIKGWRENIDVYLTKPFDAKELHATLSAILSVRKILQEKTQASLSVDGSTESLDLPAQDLKFINRLKSLIAENYQDSMFMRPQLASLLAVSERQLQRKVTGLINESPMALLRSYRLEMAAKKLTDGFQVGIVGDECGFSSVSYFAACFKKKYGMTPKKYQMTVNKKH